MQDPPDHAPISEVEDLDPEPAPRPAQLWRREFVAGVLLLVGVLAFAGWQWWQAESNRANYEAGQRAISLNHWDEARACFQAAHDYKDSAILAQNAAINVSERNKHYSAAMQLAAGEQWVQAYDEISATRKIQPDYRDIVTMTAQAESHVYDDSLLGVVVQWPSANPPGLYYRARSGWVWLRGSDASSQAQYTQRSDMLLFDMPGPAADGTGATPHNVGSTPRQTGASDRVTAAAFVGAETTTATLKVTILPFPYTGDTRLAVWGRKGMWISTRGGFDSPPGGSPVQEATNPEGPVTYITPDLSMSTTVTLTSPFSKTAMLTLLSTDEDLLLFADWDTAPDKTTTVSVYLTDAFGKVRRTLYTLTGGGIAQAWVSRDGKHVGLVTYTETQQKLYYDVALLLLDAGEVQAPVTLAREHNVYAPMGQVLSEVFSAVYLDRGPFAGKVLVVEQTQGTSRVLLLDPASAAPEVPLSRVELPGQTPFFWAGAVYSGDSLYLLGYPGQLVGRTEAIESQVLVTMKAGGTLKVHSTQSVTLPYIFLPGHDRLVVIGARIIPNTQAGPGNSASTIPYSALDQDAIEAKLIYNGPISSNGEAVSGALLAPGDKAFAYLDGRDLRVRTYDGLADVKLATGIASLQWIPAYYLPYSLH